MKSGIHPTFYPEAVVTCACGHTWTTGSTKKEIHTDVCSNCHPFFTGEQRIVDTAGQVERFMKRISAKEQISAQQPAAEEKRAKKEKRRERHAASAAPAPAPLQPPAELPLAVAQQAPQPQARAETAPAAEVVESRVEKVAPRAEAPETRVEKAAPKVEAPEARAEQVAPTAHVEQAHMEEVAPAVTVEQVRPEENAIVPPAMQIGEAASIDKIVEPVESREREVTAPRHEETPPEPLKAPRGIEEAVGAGGTAEVRDQVAEVEKPGPTPARKSAAKSTRKPTATRRAAKPAAKPKAKSTTKKSAPSKAKKKS